MVSINSRGRYFRTGFMRMALGVPATLGGAFGCYSMVKMGSFKLVLELNEDAGAIKIDQQIKKFDIGPINTSESSQTCLKKSFPANTKTFTETPEINQAYLKCMQDQTMGIHVLLALGLYAGLMMKGATATSKGFAYWQLADHSKKGTLTFRAIEGAARPIKNYDESATPSPFNVKNGFGAHASITMKPGSTVYSGHGSLLAKNSDISMNTVAVAEKETLSAMTGRILSGEGLSLIEYKNGSTEAQELLLEPKKDSQLVEIDLTNEGAILCQNGAFFASSNPVHVGLHTFKNYAFQYFGGEGISMQKVSLVDKPATILITSNGLPYTRDLKKDETLHIQKGALLALSGEARLGLEEIKGQFNRLTAGEGAFLTTVTGPGRVWLSRQGKKKNETKELISTFVDKLIPGR